MTYINSPAEYESMTPAEQSAYRCAVDAAAQVKGAVREFISRKDGAYTEWTESVNPDPTLWDWTRYIFRIAKPKPMEVLIDGALLKYVKPGQVITSIRYGGPIIDPAVRFIESPKES